MKHKIILLVAVALIALTANTILAQTSSVFVTGLKAPNKIIYSQYHGYFLVSEAGIPTVPNSGRISIISNTGFRSTLLDGLPSGPAAPNGDASGPSALWVQGDRLYIAVGNGNTALNGPAPGSEIPNPNPNSPLFSSVLEYTFYPRWVGFDSPSSNVLEPADHARLANGETVFIGTPGILGSRLRLVANFPDFTPAPRPGVPNNVRPSNPFGLVLRGNTLYVADAAQNNIRTVDLANGSTGTLITYPARMNPTPVGAPFIDPVPDSLRLFGSKLLVTFLTGFPFPAGQADVRQYDLDTNQESQLIGGLSSAIDVLPVNSDGFSNSIYTLEFSTNMLMGAPGRLQRFDTPTGQPTVISNTLISPTSMARHPSGDLLVTEIFPGRITRISSP